MDDEGEKVSRIASRKPWIDVSRGGHGKENQDRGKSDCPRIASAKRAEERNRRYEKQSGSDNPAEEAGMRQRYQVPPHAPPNPEHVCSRSGKPLIINLAVVLQLWSKRRTKGSEVVQDEEKAGCPRQCNKSRVSRS